MQSPDNNTGARLREIHAKQRAIREGIEATLVLRNAADEVAVVAQLGSGIWQPLNGRDGVSVYHVPDPTGAPGLFMTVACTEPGSHYEGSVIDQSRLLGILSGDLELNQKGYTPGQCLWLAPGEPSSWHSFGGCMAVVRYDVPPPDIDFTDIIRPVKP